MLTEHNAAKARTALSDLSGGRWANVRSEIQDDGMFVLLTAEVATLVEADLTEEQRSTIAAALNEIAPLQTGQDHGAWIVAFLRGGEVIASVLPEDVEL